MAARSVASTRVDYEQLSTHRDPYRFVYFDLLLALTNLHNNIVRNQYVDATNEIIIVLFITGRLVSN